MGVVTNNAKGEPVIARLENGAEFGFRDAATALQRHPTAEIVGHQDGTAYTADDAESPTPTTMTHDKQDVAETPNLSSMTRDELNAEAARRGVEDPASLPNKDAVIAAIEGLA